MEAVMNLIHIMVINIVFCLILLYGTLYHRLNVILVKEIMIPGNLKAKGQGKSMQASSREKRKLS